MSSELQDGVTNASLIASFLGAFLGLSYAPKMNKKQGLMALLTAWAVAVYGAPLCVMLLGHYFGVVPSPVLTNSISFFAGLTALRLVPVLLFHVEQLKNLNLPDIGGRK